MKYTITYQELSSAWLRWREENLDIGTSWFDFLGENPLRHYHGLDPREWVYEVDEKAYTRIQILNSPHWKALLKAQKIKQETS